VFELSTRSIGFKVLTGHGASIDTTTPAGKLVFGILGRTQEREFYARQSSIILGNTHVVQAAIGHVR
jgi:hypothetical protein